MARMFQSSPPSWFRIVAIVLILWGLMGVASLYMQLVVGPGADASDYDRELFAATPIWFKLVYVLAVLNGLLGAVGLLLKRRWAVLFSVNSVILVIMQFGWMFVATDIIAVKGVWVVYFPALILVVQLVQLWVANTAKQRGWLR